MRKTVQECAWESVLSTNSLITLREGVCRDVLLLNSRTLILFRTVASEFVLQVAMRRTQLKPV